MRRLIEGLFTPTRRIDGVKYLVLTSPSLAGAVEAVQVEELDPPTDSLDFLESSKNSLVHLIVTETRIRDVSMVGRLSNLRSLTLHAGRLKEGVSAGLPHLESLTIDWSPRVKPLLESPRLRSIALIGPPEEVPVEGRSLTSLVLKGITTARLPRLTVENLVLAGSQRRGRVFGISGVSGLRTLTLNRVSPADLPLEPVPAFDGIRKLVLEDCGSIPSLNAFSSAKLDELIVIGKLSVEDDSINRLSARKRHMPPRV